MTNCIICAKQILINFIFITALLFVFGQSVANTLPTDSVRVLDGKKYIVHRVVKGETLYSIAKKYQIDIQEIVRANPPAINSLNTGQYLLIPFRQEKVETIPPRKEGNFMIHTVNHGQTLYSIAKLYNVSIETIREMNPELEQGLKAGMMLKVPALPEPVSDDTIIFSNQPDTAPPPMQMRKKTIYNVGIFLPLFLSVNDTIRNTSPVPELPAPLFTRSLPAITFYEGVLLAMDSLKKEGFNGNVYIFDTENDTLKVIRTIRENDSVLSGLDLIIGPFHNREFEILSRYATGKHISIVTPMLTKNDILLENPFVFKARPSVASQLESIAGFIARQYSTKQILILRNETETEKKRADAFRVMLANITKKTRDAIAFSPPEKEKINNFSSTSELLIKELIIQDPATMNIPPMLSVSDTTLVVIPSNDQAFVSQIIPVLNDLLKNYSIIVTGISDWENYDNLEMQYLHNLSVHLTSLNHIAYSGTDFLSFARHFFEKFRTYPDDYAIQGFDIAYLFLKSLMQYGIDFSGFIKSAEINGIYTSYRFKQLGEGNGFENNYVCIKKYQDFQLIKVYPVH